MSSRHKPTTPEGQFSKAVGDRLGSANPQSFVIPILQADPPETDPTNLWMRWDGRLRGRRPNGSGGYTYTDYPLRSDITSPPAVPAYPSAPAQPATPQTYTTTFEATWSQGYLGSGAQRTDDTGNLFLPYGNDGNPAYGTQRSLVGFNYALIASTLTGSTVKSVQLMMANTDSYADSGVTIYYGIHNVTAKPSTWPDASIVSHFVTSEHWANQETKTISVPLAFATNIRDGIGKGIAIEAPSDSNQFFGIASGVGTGFVAPILIVTYVK